MRDTLLAGVFRSLCRAPVGRPETYDVDQFDEGFASTERFFGRLPNWLTLENKRVLDMGCGRGSTSIYAAQRGAASVLGVDVRAETVAFARGILGERYPSLRGRVDFRQAADPRELRGEHFDVILSKDVLEHVAGPERHVQGLRELLHEDGVLAIGFGPLWKSPYGGHIDFMTRLPWVHLMFPERVVLAERRRYVRGDDATRYAEISGGLNQMTLRRFLEIMRSSGLECRYLKTNLARSPLIGPVQALSRIPGLREFFTLNVYGVWVHPERASRRDAASTETPLLQGAAGAVVDDVAVRAPRPGQLENPQVRDEGTR
jgi:SAM-dependent methyltransferase